jgi:acetate kinase
MFPFSDLFGDLGHQAADDLTPLQPVDALGGLDALVFTGGISEHSSLVRGRAMDAPGSSGLRLDRERNASAGSDIDIAHARSLVVLNEMKRLLA